MARRNQPPSLNKLVVERLMHYYHLVAEQIESQASGHVSSAQIADLLDMDDTLVRKDLAAIGVRGRPRLGFCAQELMQAVRETLGFNGHYKCVIVGAGRLGGAIASYGGFGKYGLNIVALFDMDPLRVGDSLAGISVLPIDSIESVVRDNDVHLAVLTVPAEAAQPIADRVVEAGVRAIWNFAPTSLVLPHSVFVRHEHISVGFAELAYYLKRTSAPTDAT